MIGVVVVDGATGLTSFDGEGGFDLVVNQAGAPGTTFSGVENFIDRPLLFIPGFGGLVRRYDAPRARWARCPGTVVSDPWN